MPAPQDVKWAVLERYGSGAQTWVETGTYLGDTTALLARWAPTVFTIEPEPTLASNAAKRFEATPGVTVMTATSELALPQILQSLTGTVSFWLDGHYSAGNTFLSDNETPITAELAEIERHLARLSHVAVLVDDMRCFDPTQQAFASYPSRSFAVDWANRNALSWTIEHDIFVAWK